MTLPVRSALSWMLNISGRNAFYQDKSGSLTLRNIFTLSPMLKKTFSIFCIFTENIVSDFSTLLFKINEWLIPFLGKGVNVNILMLPTT